MAEQFYTILTSTGKAKIANATALGTKLNLTAFKVGDGSGSYYNPTESQETLKNVVWEGSVSSITVDADNPNWIVLQAIIPGDFGGFMIREAGVFDDTGKLIAVGKYPETYKPLITEGSSKDLLIKMILEVSNTASVTLKVESTTILATKKDLEVLSNSLYGDINEFKKSVNEQLVEMVNYTDLTPIVTTGTASDYVATIPANMTEVTIVPHINNLAGATLNSVPILDREGKPIGKDTLKANIPSKLVRVGSNFFIASGGGNLKLPYEQSKFNNFRILNVFDAGISTTALDSRAVYDSANSTFISTQKNDVYLRVYHFNASFLYMHADWYALEPLGVMRGVGYCTMLDGLVYVIDTNDIDNGGAVLTIYNPSNKSMISSAKYAKLQYYERKYEAIANGIVYISPSGNNTLTKFNLKTKTYNTYTILKDYIYADFHLMASNDSDYVYTLESKKLSKYNPSDFSNIFNTTIAYTGTLESTAVYKDVIHVLTGSTDGIRIYRFSTVDGGLIDTVILTEFNYLTGMSIAITENYYLITNANGTYSIKKGTNTVLSKSALKFKLLDDEKLYCSFSNYSGGVSRYSYHMASLNVE